MSKSNTLETTQHQLIVDFQVVEPWAWWGTRSNYWLNESSWDVWSPCEVNRSKWITCPFFILALWYAYIFVIRVLKECIILITVDWPNCWAKEKPEPRVLSGYFLSKTRYKKRGKTDLTIGGFKSQVSHQKHPLGFIIYKKKEKRKLTKIP